MFEYCWRGVDWVSESIDLRVYYNNESALPKALQL